MPRPRVKARPLQTLARQRSVRPGASVGPNVIRWQYTQSGETIATGLITANMGVKMRDGQPIQIGSLDQRIILVPRARHFGGRQWYFVCPAMNHRCSVAWMPPGASRFCSRQAWDGQAAYASQFATPNDRAFRGQAKIKSKLIGDHDPDEWGLPPKPKWMRWRIYNRHEEKFDVYQDTIDRRFFAVVARLLNRG